MPQNGLPENEATAIEGFLKQNVLRALSNFQENLKAYKAAIKQPPLFLLEKPAPSLRLDAFNDCRVFANRHEMIKALARGKCGAEVGVQYGDFSAFLLSSFELTELHLFDRFEDIIRDDVKNALNTHLHIGDSSSLLSQCADQYFDWIYIDGDHSYNGARKDALAAMAKVKPGGVLFFNDYTSWSPGEAIPYGVMPVVNELVNQGLDMIGVALTANGYFDVALRR